MLHLILNSSFGKASSHKDLTVQDTNLVLKLAMLINIEQDHRLCRDPTL